ncbi:glycosyltransferase [Chitinophagaceae bacterium LB-8]|uniref:Glycosyltransferase n=1 Tax=Paraflavisolibacter caeni TaxID=2982496 RepID=A0A9X2XY36_9BACT|nr:glycosyltransferase family 2 protein [Paraflavisolibacter caeni]MCU7551295.1 glycosyltransferase [Paraflavisolibacter caeni]
MGSMIGISVIVPCYNQSKYLAECIQSLQAQAYLNWECIIVNDGSTDETESIASNLVKGDERVKYIKKGNGGLSSARNAGLKVSEGEYIQFLDADDVIGENKFDEAITAFDQNSCDLVISNFQCTTKNLEEILPSYCDLKGVNFSYESILLEWDKRYTIPIHCGIFKRSLLHDFHFNENLKAKEDWIMWLHIFKLTNRFVFIDKPHAKYRLHGNGLTNDALHMYTNTVKAFRYINNQLEEKYKFDFLKKTNEYWEEKIIELDQFKKDLMASRSYKLSSGIVRIYALIYKKFFNVRHANSNHS